MSSCADGPIFHASCWRDMKHFCSGEFSEMVIEVDRHKIFFMANEIMMLTYLICYVSIYIFQAPMCLLQYIQFIGGEIGGFCFFVVFMCVVYLNV